MLRRRRSTPGSTVPSVSARTSALRLLHRRDYSIAELTTRLIDRGHDEDKVREAVTALRAEGLLDDGRTGRAHARTSALVKGRGRHRIRRELEARGLDRAAVDAAVAEVSPDTERETLERLIARASRGEPLDEAAERRLFQRLLRRGFDADAIRKSLKQAKAAHE